ncbi:MAG: hypothetical protein NT068_03060 [Candidatus Nomurabacteria bacterium]|nr:hypothetical protein [Candidatus Nomurabacteria bacterium]
MKNNVKINVYKNMFAICTVGSSPKISSVLDYITCIIAKGIWPILLSSSIVVFIWGVLQYALNPQDVKKKAEGRSFMLWGLFALTVIISIWGFVNIVIGTFQLNNANPSIQTVV